MESKYSNMTTEEVQAEIAKIDTKISALYKKNKELNAELDRRQETELADIARDLAEKIAAYKKKYNLECERSVILKGEWGEVWLDDIYSIYVPDTDISVEVP